MTILAPQLIFFFLLFKLWNGTQMTLTTQIVADLCPSSIVHSPNRRDEGGLQGFHDLPFRHHPYLHVGFVRFYAPLWDGKEKDHLGGRRRFQLGGPTDHFDGYSSV